MLFGSNGNSYTVCTQSDVCAYTHTHTHIFLTIRRRWSGKRKTWDRSEWCVPRKSLRVPFWTRVPKVRQPFSRTSVFPLRMVSPHSIFVSYACPPYHKEKLVKPGNLWSLSLSWTPAEWVRTAQCVCVIQTSHLLYHRHRLFVLRSTQNTYILCMGRTWNLWVLNLVVHTVTTGL